MDQKSKEVYKQCIQFLSGHHPARPMKQLFQELSNFVEDNQFGDNYGTGDYLQAFEVQIALLLGKETAVFMPSGTMAQQIALRIWCERKQIFRVAFHPTAHLELAEHLGYAFLHNIKRVQFAAPELLAHRLLTSDDFQDIQEPLAVILLELPQRPIGGQLPSWDTLQRIGSWAHKKKIAMHLDGARLWECKSYYNKSYADICDVFDSIYVSFYKGLGGLTGSILAGSKDFIAEAKIWQRRYGGNLKTLFPYVVSSKMGLEARLDKMEQYFTRTKEIAILMSHFQEIEIVPNPPHTNMFHLFMRGDSEKLTKVHLQLAEKYKTWLFFDPETSILPNYARTEIMIGDAALSLDIDKIQTMLTELFEQIK